MKVIREELSMISTRVDLNESRILSLEISNDKKTAQIGDMESKLTDHSERIRALERKLEDSEQYSRRNCVRIFGIPERKGEQTDDIVLTIAKEKLGIDIDINDIDRSRRTGYIGTSNQSSTSKQTDHQRSQSQDPATSTSSTRPSTALSHSNTDKKSHHRAIIVKFATYRARQLVLKVRRKLKQSGISIAEDLTAANYKILTTARKSKNVTAAWSQDGRIYVSITGKGDKKHVTSLEEANKL